MEQALDQIKEMVQSLRGMELVPMSYILNKVPGETIMEKAEAVGVSRQTYYYWIHGRSRPSPQQAERLAELTGVPMADIMTIYAT